MRLINNLYKPDIFPNSINAGFGTKLLSLHNEDSFELHQMHGHIIIDDFQSNDNTRYGDALVTDDKNKMLIVKTADCVPILYYDATINYIAASHQGWKGSMENLPGLMVKHLLQKGGKTSSISVAIGPCIGACCYEIYNPRLSHIVQAYHDIAEKIIIKCGNKTYLSLLSWCFQLLMKAGIKPQNIEYSLQCTSCRNDMFNSYNRDKGSGRMISFIEKQSL